MFLLSTYFNVFVYNVCFFTNDLCIVIFYMVFFPCFLFVLLIQFTSIVALYHAQCFFINWFS